MPFKKFQFASRNWVGVISLSLVVFAGCSSTKGDSGKTFGMGEAANVGKLTYTVVESDWKRTLEGASGQRLPKNQFLVLNLTITSRADAEVGVPLLSLLGENGAEFREEDKGDGVPQWLGFLRRLAPIESMSGRIVFDVPPGGYKLRISSGGPAETEVTALVDIPYHAAPPVVKDVDLMAVPPTK